jgi:putative DNA primase/helicase
MTELAFIDAMRAAGLEPHGDLTLTEGQLQRFRVKGDKAGSRNGWAVYHHSPLPAGAFGSWRTGESHTWRTKPAVGEPARARAERRRQLEAMHNQRVVEQHQVQAAAQARAVRLWRTARPATDDHPYLQKKAVHAYGLRQLRDMLVIPARDAAGELHTLQFIGIDGAKRFLTGGRIAGCYFSIGHPHEGMFLCEGYATAATVHAATGDAVAACFSAGNLKSVAMVLRAKFPTLRLVIAADNDSGTPGNPGVRHAFEAAAAAGALVSVPDFEGDR